jgi:hypothetical protein
MGLVLGSTENGGECGDVDTARGCGEIEGAEMGSFGTKKMFCATGLYPLRN